MSIDNNQQRKLTLTLLSGEGGRNDLIAFLYLENAVMKGEKNCLRAAAEMPEAGGRPAQRREGQVSL